jgi:hypothetical protein
VSFESLSCLFPFIEEDELQIFENKIRKSQVSRPPDRKSKETELWIENPRIAGLRTENLRKADLRTENLRITGLWTENLRRAGIWTEN